MELVNVAAPPDAAIERVVRLGPSELVWLRAQPFAVRCQPVRTQGDFKLVAPIEGHASLRQAGRQSPLAAGTFSWLDSDHPFELSVASGALLLIRMPGELLRSRHPKLDLRTALSRGRDHAGERVLAQLLQAVGREGRSLTDGLCATAANLVLDALGICAQSVGVDAQQVRTERALAYIELRLGDSSLQPSDVSREQRVSRRYLDRLFRRNIGTTLADQIRLRRLERAAVDLRFRPEELSAEVGARWGFRDPSHFARLFRRRYAMTPTEYRRSSLAR